MFFWDQTFILVIIGAVICLLAQARVKSTFGKYSKVRSMSGLTGYETAERILRANGIYDVQVGHVTGDLSDHYDPKNKILNLSDSTYSSTSVAAIGVAAHECGHAIQHNLKYMPLSFRSGLVPVAKFGSMAAWPLIFVGFFIGGDSALILIDIGIILFSASVLFQIITLPVEFNASKRAIATLRGQAMLNEEELGQAKSVLTAASLTYLAAAAASILQLLRLFLLRGRRR